MTRRMSIRKAGASSRKSAGVGLMLLGLAFLCAGMAVLYVGVVSPLHDYMDSSGWVEVMAELDSAELVETRSDDGTTWKVVARYRYRYRHTWYVGTQVGLQDFADSEREYHETLLRRLREENHKQRLTARVNPHRPDEALLVREIRTSTMVMMSLFGLVFGGAGVGIMVAGRLRWRNRQVSAGGNSASNDIVPCNQRNAALLWSFLAFVTFALSVPGTLAIPEEMARGNKAILVVLVFPLVGVWLLWTALRLWRDWLRFGPLPVRLSPAPGQLGGDVGGTVMIPLLWRGEAHLRARLQCVRNYTTGAGKNRRQNQQVLWQEKQVVALEAAGRGTRVSFCFSPPAHLPVSETPSSDYHAWELSLEGDFRNYPLLRSWTLPVVTGSGRSSVRLDTPEREQSITAYRQQDMQEAAGEIRIYRSHGGLIIESLAFRHLWASVMILVLGVFFAGIGVVLVDKISKEGAMMGVMAGFFLLFGVPLVMGGIFSLGKSLRTRVENDQLDVRRYWMGIPLWRHKVRLETLDQLQLEEGASVSGSRGTVVFVHLVVKSGKKSLRIAEGIPGREMAGRVRERLCELLQSG